MESDEYEDRIEELQKEFEKLEDSHFYEGLDSVVDKNRLSAKAVQLLFGDNKVELPQEERKDVDRTFKTWFNLTGKDKKLYQGMCLDGQPDGKGIQVVQRKNG